LATPKHTLKDFSKQVDGLLSEFYSGGDYNEFVEQIQLLKCENFQDVLISKVFRASLDLPTGTSDNNASGNNQNQNQPFQHHNNHNYNSSKYDMSPSVYINANAVNTNAVMQGYMNEYLNSNDTANNM